jgi:SAM-dependent methyltransferase
LRPVRVCAACGSARVTVAWHCADCGHQPSRVDDVISLAPAEADGYPAYRDGYFADLAAAEAQSFWYQARNGLIAWAIKRYFPDLTTFMELGCGTGYALSGVRDAFPNAQLTGTEIIAAGIEHAQRRVPSAQMLQMDARHIPFHDHFDVIGAFDVIEHIEEDTEVLAAIHRALRPGGGVVLAVPQHPALWSPHDEYTRHVRRYTASELRHKVVAAGFEVIRTTSFVSLLLPMMFVARLRMRMSDPLARQDPVNAARVSRPVNGALAPIMALESMLIRAGVSFPIGGSRLMVARKATR